MTNKQLKKDLDEKLHLTEAEKELIVALFKEYRKEEPCCGHGCCCNFNEL